MMQGHCKLKFFKTGFYLSLNLLIFDSDDFKHFLKMNKELLEVSALFYYFIDRQSHSRNFLPSHVIGNLIFLRHKVCNTHDTINFFSFLNDDFIFLRCSKHIH